MNEIEFERVTLESLRQPEHATGQALRGVSPYAAAAAIDAERELRKARRAHEMRTLRAAPSPTDMRLSERALHWLIALPEAVRPIKLGALFPRVANRLCENWHRPREMDRLFEDLLTDTRGDRRGFPLEVALELTELCEHYRASVYPVPATIWDDQYLTSCKSR
ncbi:MAG: hypothetical protein M5U08_07310 [Burkholderiales bacterium]|nr:hypothetical protein [Burkholderiales bacterium]